jgi:predicted negative regulator of RcsB-dependent stress response
MARSQHDETFNQVKEALEGFKEKYTANQKNQLRGSGKILEGLEKALKVKLAAFLRPLDAALKETKKGNYAKASKEIEKVTSKLGPDNQYKELHDAMKCLDS